MKKSINIWSFIGKTNREAMKLAKDAGFEGIELALGGEGEISMTSTDEELLSIKAYAEELGIKIPSLSSGLCWANSLTANDPEERQRAFDMVVRQLYCAKMLGAETILVIPGSVSVEFVPEWGVVDYDVVWDRALELQNKLSEHVAPRFVGLHEKIDAANAEGCEIKILGNFDNQGNREVSANAVSAIVEPYDIIVSDVDNGAQGAVAALQMVGNTDVKVLSMGAYGKEPFSLLYKNDPNYLACLNVDAWVLAQYIFDAAINYFNGVDNVTQTEIALFMVDNANVEQFWSDFE